MAGVSSDQDSEQEINNLVEMIQVQMQKVRQLQTCSENNIREPRAEYEPQYNSLSESLLIRKLEKCVLDRIHPNQKLFEELSQELLALEEYAATLSRKSKEDDDEMTRLHNNIRNLEKMATSSQSFTEELSILNDLDTIEKNIRRRFQKEKEDLKLVIQTIFPDNPEIEDIIAQTATLYISEGPDKYLKLDYSENVINDIELLKQSQIFEIHPQDPLQIKLAELS